ncbi:MAG: SPOR domain-containing protein [Kiloniellales bacterium]
MTLQQRDAGEALLARKGAAVPLGLGGLAAAPLRSGVQEPVPDRPGEAAGKADPAPPASLLSFEFLSREEESIRPAVEPRKPPRVAPPAAEARTETPSKRAPAVEPAWRMGLPKKARVRRSNGLMGGVLALTVLLGVAALGWYANYEGPGVEVEKVIPLTAPSQPAPQEQPGAAPPEQASEEPGAPAGEAAAPAEQAESTETTEAAAPVEANEPAVPTEPVPAIKPSVDVVRIDPDGSAVIAGRAAPWAELIILDNGEPIGTTAADAYGEWVFIPAAPLPIGAHDFGLVVKSVQGGVSLPAPGEPEPESRAGEDGPRADLAPVPARKPVPARAANGHGVALSENAPGFAVQLASVKTKAGAEAEWRKLQRRFPGLLSDMKLALDEAKLASRGPVIRLRTGAFGKLSDAAKLCARLAARRQECLVVKASVRN